MRTVLAYALLCLTVPVALSQPSQSIVAALRAKRYSQALELSDQALQSAPRDVQVLTMKALALKGLGRDQNALAAFRDALKIDPDYLAAIEGAAQIEYATADPAAIATLDHLLKLRPDEPTAHGMRAVLAWKQHDCAAAVTHFERSQAVIAAQPDALRQYGICLVRLKRTDAAADVFQKLVSLHPSDRPARYSLASVQILGGNYRAAIESLQPLLDGAAPDPEALALASEAHEALGDTPQAVATLRQAIVLSPKKVRYYLDFANLSFQHKSFDAGILVVTAGLQLTPESPQLHLARGILYVQTGQVEQADADFAAADRLDPQQLGNADVRVLEYLQQNNLEAAVRLVRQQIKSRPDNPFLYYLLGEVLNWQGPAADSPEFREALESAAKAVKLQPDLMLARNLLSRLYLDSGQVKPAIEQCRQVLRDNPYDPVALYRLMRALKMSGDPDDAKEIPDVVRRFNEARQLATEKETLANRYRLVEESPAAAK